jgi:type II secretory pathway pseudopilin PulG
MELIVVLVLVGVMAAAVTPLFADSVGRTRADRSVRDLMATMRHAGERAVLEGVEYRLYLNTRDESYRLARMGLDEETGRVAPLPVESREGVRRVLPDGVRFERIEARRGEERHERYIAFYPGASCDFAEVTIEDAGGENFEITLEGTLSRIAMEAE